MKKLICLSIILSLLTLAACVGSSGGGSNQNNNAQASQQKLFTKWYDANGVLAWDFTGMKTGVDYPYSGTCSPTINIEQGHIRVLPTILGCSNAPNYFYLYSITGNTLQLCNEKSSPVACAEYTSY